MEFARNGVSGSRSLGGVSEPAEGTGGATRGEWACRYSGLNDRAEWSDGESGDESLWCTLAGESAGELSGDRFQRKSSRLAKSKVGRGGFDSRLGGWVYQGRAG